MGKGIKYFAHSSQEVSPEVQPYPHLGDQLQQPGFYPMSTVSTLKGLARDIGKSQDVEINVENSTAIASVVAHIANYEDEVKRALDYYGGNNADPPELSPALNEWLGMLAAVQLRGVYSLNIGIECTDLRAVDGTLKNIVQEKLRELWGGYNARNANGDEFMRIAYLTLDGQKFAILDPKIGLCPLATRKPLFAERVQWCNSAGVWQNPLEVWNINARVSPEAEYLYALLFHFSNVNLGNQDDLCKTIRLLMAYIKRFHAKQNANVNQIGEKFVGMINANYLAAGRIPDPGDESANFPASLRDLMYNGAPPELENVEFFTQKLLFFSLADSQYEHIKTALGATSARPQSIAYFNEDERTVCHLCYLPPLAVRAVKMLAEKDIKFDFSLVAERQSPGNANEKINCKVTVRYVLPSGCRLSKVRNYTLCNDIVQEAQGISYVSTLPVLNFWPNIQCEPAEDWKLYYVSKFAPQPISMKGGRALAQYFGYTEAKSSEMEYVSFTERYRFGALDEQIKVRVEAEDVYNADGEEVIDKTFDARGPDPVSKETWQIYRMDKRPSCVTIRLGDADCGMLAIPKKTPVPRSETTALFSLDFGTTSSMLYYKLDIEGASAMSVSAPENYALSLIPFALENAATDLVPLENKTLQWMGTRPDVRVPLKKINTCVQENGGLTAVPAGREARESLYYPFAAFRHQALNYYVFENVQPEQGKRLKEYGIHFGLKFGSNDMTNRRAVRGFFSYLLTLAALEARSNGIGEVKLTATYPNQSGYSNLQTQLNDALRNINGRFFNLVINPDISYRRETTSAIGYFLNNTPPGLTLDKGFVVVDIGGGTTDISLVKREEQGLATSRESIRFAGDALIRQALVVSALKHRAHVERAIETMFDGGGSVVERFASTFNTKLLGSRMAAPFTPEDYNTKYPEVAEVFDALLREPALMPNYSYITPPESLAMDALQEYDTVLEHFSYRIKLRYLLLFYFVAQHIKGHEAEVAFDDKISILLGGFGSRGLCFCTGQPFDEENAGRINYSRFMQPITAIFRKVLQKDVSLYTPLASDKEEVVVGALTDYARAMTTDNVIGNGNDAGRNNGVLDLNRRDPALHEKYSEQLETMIAVFDEVLDPANNKIADLNMFYENIYGIWSEMKKYLSRKGDGAAVWLEAAQALYRREGDSVVTLPENVPVAAAILACFDGLSAV